MHRQASGAAASQPVSRRRHLVRGRVRVRVRVRVRGRGRVRVGVRVKGER